jgi:hypothetical protein
MSAPPSCGLDMYPHLGFHKMFALGTGTMLSSWPLEALLLPKWFDFHFHEGLEPLAFWGSISSEMV